MGIPITWVNIGYILPPIDHESFAATKIMGKYSDKLYTSNFKTLFSSLGRSLLGLGASVATSLVMSHWQPDFSTNTAVGIAAGIFAFVVVIISLGCGLSACARSFSLLLYLIAHKIHVLRLQRHLSKHTSYESFITEYPRYKTFTTTRLAFRGRRQ